MKLFASLLAGTALAALALQFAGCSCTAAGCSSGAGTSLDVRRGLAALDGAVIVTCHNDDCVEHTFVVQPNDLGELQGFCDFADRIFCNATPVGPEFTTIAIEITVDDDVAEDGDFYSVTILDAADPDVVLASREGEVEYDENKPNGEFCEGTCYNATF